MNAVLKDYQSCLFVLVVQRLCFQNWVYFGFESVLYLVYR